MSCDAYRERMKSKVAYVLKGGEGAGTHWTQGARRVLNGATAARRMEVILREDQGWPPPSLQLPFSKGAMPAARQGAVCLSCGSSCKFASWALDGEECGGQLAKRWESSLVGTCICVCLCLSQFLSHWLQLYLRTLWHLDRPSVQKRDVRPFCAHL